MRLATVSGRLALVVGEGADVRAVDVVRAGGPATALEALAGWESFRHWADGRRDDGEPFSLDALGPPVPDPRQVFGIGLNYRSHAEETATGAPSGMPPTFTKFRSSLAGPVGELVLPSGATVDWEVELVVVIGREATRVEEDRAWGCVAGLAVGQDYSDRRMQLDGPVPQFSLGKSHPGFAPFGPWLTTVDAVADPDDIALECEVNGTRVQRDRTSSMIFPVPTIIARLSSVVTLYPGDLVFTGTPSGVGMARDPQVFLRHGDVVESRAAGLGSLRQVCR